jgi:hypothetical protein
VLDSDGESDSLFSPIYATVHSYAIVLPYQLELAPIKSTAGEEEKLILTNRPDSSSSVDTLGPPLLLRRRSAAASGRCCSSAAASQVQDVAHRETVVFSPAVSSRMYRKRSCVRIAGGCIAPYDADDHPDGSGVCHSIAGEESNVNAQAWLHKRANGDNRGMFCCLVMTRICNGIRTRKLIKQLRIAEIPVLLLGHDEVSFL